MTTPGPSPTSQQAFANTYRIQIVKLPPASKPGFFGRWWFGSESTALLFNLEVPESEVLPLIRSSVELLETQQPHIALGSAVAEAHGVPEPPDNARIKKGT